MGDCGQALTSEDKAVHGGPVENMARHLFRGLLSYYSYAYSLAYTLSD